jgi:hypothetical protein
MSAPRKIEQDSSESKKQQELLRIMQFKIRQQTVEMGAVENNLVNDIKA